MFTISVINQKGGSAKTTTAVNLASSLVKAGKKVLLIDFDQQSSSSHWLGGSTCSGQELMESLLDTLDLSLLSSRPNRISISFPVVVALSISIALRWRSRAPKHSCATL